MKLTRLDVAEMAERYVQRVMDMKNTRTDQEANWHWRHLAQFGDRVRRTMNRLAKIK